MSKLAGDHVRVLVDGYELTGDSNHLSIRDARDQHDVTGFGDAAHHFINGQVQAPVTLNGFLTTTAEIGTHPVIQGAYAAGVPVSLEVLVGQNAAPTSGDPKYSGEFIIQSYTPKLETGGAVSFTAVLQPATGTAPAWGTVS